MEITADIITRIKEAEGGFQVNGTTFVPLGHRFNAAISEWALNGGEIESAEIPAPADHRAIARDAIDVAAGVARDAFVSPGQLVSEEYRLAKSDAVAWIAAGSPTDAVPASIAVWAQAKGWTAAQAAQDVLDTEAAWMGALAAIRQQRLLGKAAVDAAEDDADFQAVAQSYIDALNNIRPPEE